MRLRYSKKENKKCNKEQKVLQSRIAKLESTLEERDSQISNLEKTIELGKGMIVVHENHSKKPNITINSTTKQKLSTIPTSNIRPLTLGTIDEDLHKYTKELYMMGEDGVVKFIQGVTELKVDGITERNYACTDRSRNTFYRLLESKEWKHDGGAKFINEVLDKLAEPGKGYLDDIRDESFYALAKDLPNKDKLGMLTADLNMFQLGLEKICTNRDTVHTKVKNKIREIASV